MVLDLARTIALMLGALGTGMGLLYALARIEPWVERTQPDPRVARVRAGRAVGGPVGGPVAGAVAGREPADRSAPPPPPRNEAFPGATSERPPDDVPTADDAPAADDAWPELVEAGVQSGARGASPRHALHR